MEIILPVKQPFSLASTLRSHGWVQLAPFASENPYEAFSYANQLDSGRTVLWGVEPVEGGAKVTVDGELNSEEEVEVVGKLTWILDLERDLAPFYAIARQEPKLAHVEQQAHGRILRSASLFEDTVKTILTTNTAWSGTKRMVQTLVDLHGRPALVPGENEGPPFGDRPARAFPTPAELARADVEALRQEAKLGYRAPYVSELARRVSSGELDLEALKTADLPTPELRKELLAIKGIGAYAAANLLMLLGRTDYIPIDSYALKVVSEEFHGGEPVTPSDVEAAFERFGEWKGMAFWFWNYA